MARASGKKMPMSVINYKKLASLIDDPNVKLFRKDSMNNDNNSKSLVPVDHKAFMKQYKAIFVSDAEQRQERYRLTMAKINNRKNEMAEHREKQRKEDAETADVTGATTDAATALVPSDPHQCLLQDQLAREKDHFESTDHRIREHTTKTKKPKFKAQGKLVQILPKKQCERLQELLVRMPYERSYDDSVHVLNILQNYEPLIRQIPLFELKELAVTATLDTYEDSGVVVFGASGFHIVIRGSVKPLAAPYLEYLDDEDNELLVAATPSSFPRMTTVATSEAENAEVDSVGDFNHEDTGSKTGFLAELLQDTTISGLPNDPSNGSRLPTIGEDGLNLEVPAATDVISRQSSRRHQVSFVDDRNGSKNNSQIILEKEKTSQEAKRSSISIRRSGTTDIAPERETTNISDVSKQRSMLSSVITLGPGECFGTLRTRRPHDTKNEGLLCRVNESKTVILRLSASSYDRITKALTQRQLDKKANLISTCEAYRFWSRLALESLAKCSTWVTFPPGTVLAAEGDVCPYVGYLLSGECRIARRIIVKEMVGTREVKKRKEVIMGLFEPGNSFGEKCLCEGKPMNFTLIAVTECDLAVLNDESIQDIDSGVKQLLAQVEPTGPTWQAAQYTEDEIHNEFISQENDRRWSDYRRQVITEVINQQGIMPGYGRWTKT